MNHLSKLNIAQRRRILYENRGMLKRVADRIGIGPSGVSRVFWGKAVSKAIQDELNSELDVILNNRMREVGS